jgi:hypothetical protein
MRTLDASFVTALNETATTPLTLVELMTPTPLRLGRIALSALGRSFTAASFQVSIDSSGGTLSVFNEGGTLGSTVISEGVAGSRCRIWQTYVTGDVVSPPNLLLSPDDFDGAAWSKVSGASVVTGAPIGWQRLDDTSSRSRFSQSVTVPSAAGTYTFQVAIRKGSNVDGSQIGTCGFDFVDEGSPSSFPSALFDANAGAVVSGAFDVDSSGDAWILTKELAKDAGDTAISISIFPWTNNIISSSVTSSAQGYTDWRAPMIRAGGASNGVEQPVLVFEGSVTSADVGEYVTYSLQQFSPRQVPSKRITEQDFGLIGTVGAKNRAI